jgi:pyruvate,water dikinase
MRAMLRVREAMGLTNLKLMVPFCRRLDEARAVLAAMAATAWCAAKVGALEVYVMCEIPNNVLLIDEFAELFDGFSIGSNDLTQLTLGVDRDSAIVADSFDEQDPGMLKMLKMAVEGAKAQPAATAASAARRRRTTSRSRATWSSWASTASA